MPNEESTMPVDVETALADLEGDLAPTSLVKKVDDESPDRITNEFPAVFKLAELLCTNAKSFLPKGVRTPGKVAAAIITGRELGIGAMESLRSLHIVNGKVQMESRLMLSLAARHGVRHKWVERSRSRACIRLWRPGYDEEGEEFEWTEEDARDAGLINKDVWRKYRRKMLCWRAVSDAIDLYCPDVLLGVYAPGELIGIEGVVDMLEVSKIPDDVPGLDDDDDLDDDDNPNTIIDVEVEGDADDDSDTLD